MRRALVGALAFALAPAVGAQSVGLSAMGQAIRSAAGRGLIRLPDQVNPLQPKVGDQLPPKEGRLPAPLKDDQTQVFDIVKAPHLRQLPDGKREVSGGVEVRHRGYQMFADRVVFDEAAEIATGYGHVYIIGEDAVIRGEEVEVNFRNETFVARDTRSDLRPSLMQGRVLSDVYTRGGLLYGNQREIFGENTFLTTCDLERPHYNIEAEKTDVRPGRRVIFRKARIRLFGRTVLKLPYLSVPLDERTYRYLPEVGQSQDEGYFAKFRFGIPLRGDDNLDTRLDLYSKLGIGLGGDYLYNTDRIRGQLSVFGIFGRANTLTANSRHYQQFSFGNLTLENSLQRNNYLNAPQSSIFNSRVTLMIPQGRSGTRLTYFRNSNESPNFSSVQQTFGLSDNRIFNPRFKTSLDLALAHSNSSFGTTSNEREQLDVKFRAEEDLRRATAQFEYQRTVPIGEGTNFFGTQERTPFISLLSDSRKLFGTSFDRILPFRSELSWGEFSDSQKGKISRGNFDFTFNKPDRSDHRFRVDFNGRFKQGVYSDDTAQYVLNMGTNLSYRLGSDTALNLRYTYLRPYGFSPLQLDRTGRTNVVSSDVSFRPFRALLIGAQTGYDLLQLQQGQPTAWQNVGLRAEYSPASYLQLRALSVYDSFQGGWNSLRLDLAYRPGATYVSAGARYDGVRKQWAAANLFVDGFKWGRLRTSFLLAYNGYIKEFEARHFQFTYDLHCAEAVFTIIDNPVGFRSGTSFNIFIRLKALPFDTPFGIGQRGQPIGTGTGISY